MLAINVDEAAIGAYMAQRKSAGAANATINRELAFLKRGFRLNRKLLSSIPEIRLLKEAPPREGFVTLEQLERAFHHLPQDFADTIEFLFRSCWRPGDVYSLQWPDINVDTKEIRVRAANEKTGNSRTIPLHGAIADIIARRRGAAARWQAEHPNAPPIPWVFFHSSSGRQIKRIRTNRGSWATACRKAGLGHVLIHDQRRSGMRHFVNNGVADMKTVMAFSGHKTTSVFLRYRIVDSDDMRRALDTVEEQHAAKTQATPGKVLPFASKTA